jgi:hypothetical protein
MRKMLTLLLVALLHRLDQALAASYFESLAIRQRLAELNRKAEVRGDFDRYTPNSRP